MAGIKIWTRLLEVDQADCVVEQKRTRTTITWYEHCHYTRYD